jgi:uncharacterized protein (DUF983 family)
MPVPSKLSAILEARCPQCRDGHMFEFPLSNYRKFSRMHSHCPVCRIRFEIEPGFFIGAMYVSYVMSLVIFFTVSILIYFLFNNPDFYYYMIGIPLVVLILLPIMYRYSRVLFLHLFGGIKYDAGDRTII